MITLILGKNKLDVSLIESDMPTSLWHWNKLVCRLIHSTNVHHTTDSIHIVYYKAITLKCDPLINWPSIFQSTWINIKIQRFSDIRYVPNDIKINKFRVVHFHNIYCCWCKKKCFPSSRRITKCFFVIVKGKKCNDKQKRKSISIYLKLCACA